jgi:CheY-like chemotaxis protein
MEKAMKKIMIVEENELNIDLLVQLLEDEYELITALNGAEAVKLAAQEIPDLILMDMAMPVMDGWEATRRIKAQDALREIPIIGLSSYAMVGDAEKALDAGCDDYLTKPLDEDLLFEKLNNFLKGSGQTHG